MNIEKNRTAIVMWSFGNESGNTSGTKAIQKAIKEVMKPIDHTRPIHYCGLGSAGGTDVDSQMYAGVSGVYSKGKVKNHMPYLQCEYAHAMGNSVVNLYEYWEAFRSSGCNGKNERDAVKWQFLYDGNLGIPERRRLLQYDHW